MTQTTKHLFSIAHVPCLVLALAAAGCVTDDDADTAPSASSLVQLECPAVIAGEILATSFEFGEPADGVEIGDGVRVAIAKA